MLTTMAVIGRSFGYFLVGPLIFFLLFAGMMWLMTRRRPLHHPEPWMHPHRAGLAVLEERYANGEIDRDEFLAKREDLLPGTDNA